MDTSKLIIIAELLIAIIFMVIALFAWRSMGRNDRIAFLLIPLVATLAIFATGFSHLVLVVGYFTLIAAHIWEDAMTDMLNKWAPELCAVVSAGLIVVAMWSPIIRFSFEWWVMLLGSLPFLAYSCYSFVKQLQHQKPAVTSS